MLLALITLASLGKVFTFLVMLSILIVLHEAGHFYVARRNGVRVCEFALGMGPKIVGWTSPRSGTLYSLRMLPIGGFCAMEGEDGKTTEAEQQRNFRELSVEERVQVAGSFQNKSPWQRLAIVLAGPVANFILAYVILLVGAVAFGAPNDKMPPIVAEVTANSPAQRAGVAVGDQIVAVDAQAVTSSDQVVGRFHTSLGKPLDVTFEHGGASRVLRLTPAACPKPEPATFGCIGILPSPGYSHISLSDAIYTSGVNYANVANETFMSVGLLVSHFTSYASQVSGVVGMGQVATVIQDIGWGPYFMLAATISFALGFFNLLPLPALDGGRAAFILAELVRGKPVDTEKEAMVHLTGLAALMALMLLIAYHDIARIVSGKGFF